MLPFLTQAARLSMPLFAALLASCSSDPMSFETYTQRATAQGKKVDVQKTPKCTDALAYNYANSVATIFSSRATGSRYARETSDTALKGLDAFAGAAGTLSINAAELGTMGLVGVGLGHLRTIFDAKARSTAYTEAARRIRAAIKDFRAHNLNEISETSLSPNGWTLANIVHANIEIVHDILNGHLVTPEHLEQASERMTREGATPQRVGTKPVNNIESPMLTVPNARLQAAENMPVSRTRMVSAEEFAALKKSLDIVRTRKPLFEEFTQLLSGVNDSTKLTAEGKAAIWPKVVKGAGLEDTIKSDEEGRTQVNGNDINQFFQTKASIDQQEALMREIKKNSPQ
jgi:hypothetical protein